MSLCAIHNVTTTYLEYFQQGQEEENIMIHNLVYTNMLHKTHGKFGLKPYTCKYTQIYRELKR